MHYRLEHEVKRRHGMSKREHDQLVEAQGGKCAACGDILTAPQIDHDHAHCSGRQGCLQCIRGAICQGCNIALGATGDNIEKLSSLVAYLLRWETKKPPAFAGGSS